MCISNAIKVEPLDRPHFVSLWGIFVRRRRRRADRNLSSLHAAPADMKELQRERPDHGGDQRFEFQGRTAFR